jgi:periplasmic protein TonB
VETRDRLDEWVLLKVLALSFVAHVALVAAWPEAAPRFVPRPSPPELAFFEAPAKETVEVVKPAPAPAPVQRSTRPARRPPAAAPTPATAPASPAVTPEPVGLPLFQLPAQSNLPPGRFDTPSGRGPAGPQTSSRDESAGLGDTEPVPSGEVRIAYPADARERGVEGSVRLRVTVDANGIVQDVIILSGPGFGLDEAAREALKRFKFKPATRGGEAVDATFVYTYSFLLD